MQSNKQEESLGELVFESVVDLWYSQADCGTIGRYTLAVIVIIGFILGLVVMIAGVVVGVSGYVIASAQIHCVACVFLGGVQVLWNGTGEASSPWRIYFYFGMAVLMLPRALSGS